VDICHEAFATLRWSVKGKYDYKATDEPEKRAKQIEVIRKKFAAHRGGTGR